MSGRSKKEAVAVHSVPPASSAGEMPEVKDSRWLVPGVCIFLAAIVWVVFGQTLGHEFVNFDDNLYVYENSAVTRGLNLKGVEWAFTHIVVFNWHPLTIVSHMLDCRLYGLNAGGHHLTSVLLHTASVILLFLVLRRMTGFLWRSAFVAAVFAIHPLRVESVAWVAERKDVLSGLFFMLTLWAYTRYVTSGQPSPRFGTASKWQVTRADSTPSPATRHPSLFYCLVLLFFVLGLMSKPMVVTLPFVLLLLDYWPLKRFTQPGGRLVPWHLIAEKVPLLALSGATCVVTLFAQKEAIAPLPLSLRIGNALVSYVAYLGQMIYPAGLAVYYPYPENGLPLWKIVVALVLLLVISAGAVAARRKQPWLVFGWLWYLGMLVPAIGLIQSGLRARADRYTYLPQIGLYLLLTWAVGDFTVSWRHRRQILGVAAFGVIAALMVCAWKQASYWRNNESLWTRTLACTSGNYVAHNELGNILLQRGRVDEAMVHYQQALQIKPDSVEACYHLGNALFQKGNLDEAIAQYQQALQNKPDFAEACYNLGNTLFQKGRVDEAMVYFQKALKITPDFAEAHINLGNALLQKGRVDEAIAQYQQALQITPDNAKAHNNFGSALLQKGRLNEAITHYQKALQITPDNAAVRSNLDNALLQKGRVDEVITH